MLNMIFKADSYISVPVADGVKAGTPVKVGKLVGVTITDEGDGGNEALFASVALEGGVRLIGEKTIVYAVGDAVYLSAAGKITKTATDTPFGIVTHEPKAGTSAEAGIIVKIVQNVPFDIA